MEESHLRDLPFEHGIKSLWRMVVCFRERELSDLKYQKKKLNLCEWHIPEALESLFEGLLRSYRFHAPLFTKFLYRNLRFYAYKVQLLQTLKLEDKLRRKEFAVTMLERVDSDPGFLKCVCSSDKSTFHVSGLLNRHNLRIWGSENRHDTCKLK